MDVCLGRVHAASYNTNRIGGVMIRVLASSAVDPETHIHVIKGTTI
jgi:hypothetical protein